MPFFVHASVADVYERGRWKKKRLSLKISRQSEIFTYQNRLWMLDFSDFSTSGRFKVYDSVNGFSWKLKGTPSFALEDQGEENPVFSLKVSVAENRVLLYDLAQKKVYESRNLLSWKFLASLPFPGQLEEASPVEKQYLLKNYLAYARIFYTRRGFFAFVPQSWKGGGEVWKSADGAVFEKISDYGGAFQEKLVFFSRGRFYLLENAIEDSGAASQAFWIRVSSDAVKWQDYPSKKLFVWSFSRPFHRDMQWVFAAGRVWIAFQNYQNRVEVFSSANLIRWKREKIFALKEDFKLYSYKNTLFIRN